MSGAKHYVTRCSFGLLAASLAGTLRDSCGREPYGIHAEHEQNIGMNARETCSTGVYWHPSHIYIYIYREREREREKEREREM